MVFYTCGPNEAMVVSGFCRSPPVMVAGGRVFVFPCVQKIQRISLNTLTLNVKSEKVYTRHGVPISVTGIAQVKIQGQNKEMLAAACQMFLGKSESEVAQISLETLEGHQRAIMAHMTVEEIYKDRQKFSEQVFKVASSDLVNMGISVVSYTLKDIHDDQDYLHSLGKARTAQVQKDARIGEAEAKRDAGIKEAKAKQEKVSAQYLSEIEMAKAQRDFELKKAAYDIEVNTKKAESDLAYQLQVAKTKQKIEEQKMQVLVVERTQQIQLQEQEIIRREKELEAKVKKPAEAERFRLEKLAEAQRQQLITQAEAEAEAVRVKGEANAFAIEAKARADAEQMAKKAEAFQQFQDAAMVDMLLEKLPQVAAEISKPLTEVKKIKMVSSGTGEVGAAKITGEVLDILNRLPETVEKLTGISITQTGQKKPGMS
ncbi:flotillin-1 [Microcaecilia unicolor]|uniref:Flotillin n=2 Tax=Microcaecilia unicolor TaxID=1415580 RepID=A0A6P7XJA8_9AMPH|nr:flotillin-1 [Microcaecilia unicolor]XP_030053279.1 flotillin-1 [Microcaecilia unicolor]XP_030053280.1 flotillin-1 [Microcaecilia unicolor]XP_030053281.1 flotillin-1 [Microcaecilia unicolor]